MTVQNSATAATYLFDVQRTRIVTETVRVRAESAEAAARKATELVDDLGEAPNSSSRPEPWEASMLCPRCGGKTMIASDGWAECSWGIHCGWTQFEDSIELAQKSGWML